MCVCGVSRVPVLLRKYLRNSICRFSRVEYSQAPGNENPSAKFTLLSHRAVLSLKGKDTTNFLQGIVTNDITLLPEMKCMYAMLLNQHGRVINDVMLYHQNSDESDEILMEGEKESIRSLIKTLKLYKLRKKVTITARDDVTVIQAMAPTPQFDLRIPFEEILATGVDPRSPILGHRVLINGSVEDSTDVDQDTSDYHYKRMYNGIPEGGLDLPPGNCLPLESNLDFMNGVSFHKGCYIGQELTARTRYTGVIRKRLLPVTIKSKGDIEPGEAISTEKGRGAGKFRSLHPNGEIGLALVRLNYAEGKLKTKTGGVELECHIPPWWPSKDGTEFSDGVCGPNIEGSI